MVFHKKDLKMYQKEQTNFSVKEMQPQNQTLDQVTSVGEQKWQTQMKPSLSTGMCKTKYWDD